MLGRSDGTLNPNGVRFGSAEIYNIGKIKVNKLRISQANSWCMYRYMLDQKMKRHLIPLHSYSIRIIPSLIAYSLCVQSGESFNMSEFGLIPFVKIVLHTSYSSVLLFSVQF